MKRLLLGALVVAGLGVGLVHGHVQGWFVPDRSVAEIEATLTPHDEVFRPEGAGPFPTVVFFHGCGGLRSSLRQWATTLQGAGVLVVATNSLEGRDVTWEEACDGRKLLGTERAGDAWVSLARVRRRPDVDPSRVVLMGWSHGAWSVMELFALTGGQRPAGLAENPATRFDDIAGLVLLYPYCGFAANALRSWPTSPPTLLLLAEQDSIVSSEACVAWGQGRDGVTTHVYPGVDHGFDQAIPSGLWESTWDETAGTDARRRVLAFLAERIGPIGATR